MLQMPEAATGGVLWKKLFLKILQNSQKKPVPEETTLNFVKFLRPTFLQNSGWLLLKCRQCKNEMREIDYLCCRELDAMKIPERKGSILPSSFYRHLPDN